MMVFQRKSILLSLSFVAAMALSACDPSSTRVSGSVYYDSMLWNDYYYGGYRPGYRPPDRPDRPERPDRPDRPVRPPGGGIDPGFSRPPAANRPSHRPSPGRGRGRR